MPISLATGGLGGGGAAGGAAAGGGGFLAAVNPWLAAGSLALPLISGLLGGGYEAGAPAPPPVDNSGQMGVANPFNANTGVSQLAQGNNFGLPIPNALSGVEKPESSFALPDALKKAGDFGGEFLSNVNNTLESPAKLTGLGLLGDINPRLVYAGLLAAGLFDKDGGY